MYWNVYVQYITGVDLCMVKDRQVQTKNVMDYISGFVVVLEMMDYTPVNMHTHNKYPLPLYTGKVKEKPVQKENRFLFKWNWFSLCDVSTQLNST